MPASLLVAAHGTKSAAGSATTRALIDAIAAARPDTSVSLCFLDVATPSLPDALDAVDGTVVVVVPLLLSAGYHVRTDIPAVVEGREQVIVARHLGPDPAVLDAVAQRLFEAASPLPSRVALAAIASSRSSARDEVDVAAARLAERIDRQVDVLPLAGDIDEADLPDAVAVYLLAEGGFLTSLRDAARGRAVAEPIGVHPALVALVWARYDEANAAAGVR